MSIIIDIIVIGIILLSTFLGYKKGLIGVAFKIASFLIAIIITLVLFKPISNYILNKTLIGQTIENAIVEKLSTQKIEDGQIEKEDSNLPEVVVNYINDSFQDTINEAKDNVIEIVAKNLTRSSNKYSCYNWFIYNNKITVTICKSNLRSNFRTSNNKTI